MIPMNQQTSRFWRHWSCIGDPTWEFRPFWGETARSPVGRNWALLGGIKLPVYQNFSGGQPEFDYTVAPKIETHT